MLRFSRETDSVYVREREGREGRGERERERVVIVSLLKGGIGVDSILGSFKPCMLRFNAVKRKYKLIP